MESHEVHLVYLWQNMSCILFVFQASSPESHIQQTPLGMQSYVKLNIELC